MYISEQCRHGEFEADKAHSTLVGIISPLVDIGLTVSQNLGKALALEALVAVAALVNIYFLPSKLGGS